MSSPKKKSPAADMASPAPRPPGPGVEDPSLDEPTAPVAPPPPKASQQGPATVTPTDPRLRPDPDRYGLREPEVPTLVEHGLTDAGSYVQPFEDPLWGVIH